MTVPVVCIGRLGSAVGPLPQLELKELPRSLRVQSRHGFGLLRLFTVGVSLVLQVPQKQHCGDKGAEVMAMDHFWYFIRHRSQMGSLLQCAFQEDALPVDCAQSPLAC